MRVIIVGGGLAGLTLASALEKATIDFVLLEARGRFDPQVGASIGLNAAAMRILDQLGAAEEIVRNTAPVELSKVHRSDGTLVMPPAFTFQILKARFGYGVSFLDRQRALKALMDSIAQKDKMLPNKTVLRIDQTDSGVSVKCEDGSSYNGDMVVGCDGVNSKASTRSEMCRLAREKDPDHFRVMNETRMSAEFNCLFGISDPVDGLIEGTVDTLFDKGRSMLVITGKHGRVFWFYHEKLDKVYYTDAKDFPRYSQADAEKLALKNAWRPVTETVTLGDLWEKRVSYTLVPLEEALFNIWSWGRIATVGDNAHKMTPNHGQAGNSAIESAAALANQLQRVHDEGPITSQTIRSALRKWQEKRQARVNATVKEAAAVCRLQALDSRMAPFVMNYVVPNATESLLRLVTDALIGAEIIEYLPVPARSFEGSCPFNQSQGIGKHESVLKRMAIASPLLVLSCWVATMTPMDSVNDSMHQFLQLTKLGERAQFLQNLHVFAGESVIYAIWLIESNRRANVMTFAQFPTIFWLLGLRFGPGVISPCYYALHFALSGVERFAAADARLTNVAYTRLILPLIVLFMGVQLFLSLNGYSIRVDMAWWHWRWMLQPQSLIAITQLIVVKTRMSKVSMHEDTMDNQIRDLPYIRWCLCALSAVSAASWIATRQSVLLDAFSPPLFPDGDLLGLNQQVTLLASLFWVGLLIHDIKSAGMVKESWAKILAIGFVSGALAGPVVSVALGWVWREEMLASKRERHAVTRDMYSERSILDVQREMLLPRGKEAK